MLSRSLAGTIGIDAAMVGLALGAHHVPAAYRTALRHVKFACAARLAFIHLDDLRNHVAAAFDQHPVADPHAQPLDLVHVVQRGAAHRSAADRNRLERCDRRELAGAADLHQDVFDLRLARARRVLVSDRPARSFAGKAQLLLQRDAIDLHDDAVGFVRQAVALALPLRG